MDKFLQGNIVKSPSSDVGHTKSLSVIMNGNRWELVLKHWTGESSGWESWCWSIGPEKVQGGRVGVEALDRRKFRVGELVLKHWTGESSGWDSWCWSIGPEKVQGGRVGVEALDRRKFRVGELVLKHWTGESSGWESWCWSIGPEKVQGGRVGVEALDWRKFRVGELVLKHWTGESSGWECNFKETSLEFSSKGGCSLWWFYSDRFQGPLL